MRHFWLRPWCWVKDHDRVMWVRVTGLTVSCRRCGKVLIS